MKNSKEKRRVYLKMSSVNHAVELIEQAIGDYHLSPEKLGSQSIAAQESLGRVTAEPLFAAQSNPHYSASAMDGYSVASDSTVGASEANPLILHVPEQARPINTGEPLPKGHDAVIMIEDVHGLPDNSIEIMAAASPWQHIRLLGEDLVATEMIVPAGHLLRSVDVATLLASQTSIVPVVKKPKVALIPTGSEVIEPGIAPKDGQVIDYDSSLLAGMISSWGGEPVFLEKVDDQPELIRAALKSAVGQYDVVAMIAGSSAGTADHVPNAIDALGDLVFHGVRLSPGKPTAFGCIDGKPVFGVPGYSVAAWMAFDLFAKIVIHRLQGRATPKRDQITAKVKRKITSKSGVLEFLRVRLARVGNDRVAVPMKRGSGAINSLAQSDGLAVIPEMDEGLGAGESVSVELFIPRDNIERTVLAVGSHDMALDSLAIEMMKPNREVSEPFRLASVHVGSMGGLRALSQGEGHLAGVHLLDPRDSTYNVSYIKDILPELPLKLVNLVYRDVGLMVAKGNPKGITIIEDLGRDDVVMINRQRGAGTRVLLDHLLNQKEVQAEKIRGYGREVTTHTMVAAAVSGGAANVGIGIKAAAQALGLDFIALTQERYDLVIPNEFSDFGGIVRLLDIVRGKGEASQRFRQIISEMGGYTFTDTGKVLYEQ